MKAENMKLLKEACNDDSRQIMEAYPERVRWAVSYFLNELAHELFEYRNKDLTFYLDLRRSVPDNCLAEAVLLLKDLDYDVIYNETEARIVL